MGKIPILTHIFQMGWNHQLELGVAPSQDSSDHQDYYMFRLGDPNRSTFIYHDCILWGGHIQVLSRVGEITPQR